MAGDDEGNGGGHLAEVIAEEADDDIKREQFTERHRPGGYAAAADDQDHDAGESEQRVLNQTVSGLRGAKRGGGAAQFFKLSALSPSLELFGGLQSGQVEHLQDEEHAAAEGFESLMVE